MGAGKGGPVQEKMRKAEAEAFAEWIKRSAADPKLRALPKLDPAKLAKPKRPDAVIRHARKDRVLESFERNVWAMRFRCMGCHAEGTEANRRHVKKHGPRMSFFKEAGPEATLDYLRGSRLMDTTAPEKSLLLRKPLNTVPHGGGKKFAMGDQGHKAFRAFAEDYARIARDSYADAASLPKEDGIQRFGSQTWLKLDKTPPAWAGKLLQADVFAWDAKARKWEAEPVATADREVWGKGRLWQSNLTFLAPKGSARAKAWAKGAPALPGGRYLVRVRVDGTGRLAKDWSARLGEADEAGAAEVESSWPVGFGSMTVLDAAKVRKGR